MIDDEGPGPDDLQRFGGDTAFCPECGTEVWDQVEICPSCGSLIGGRTRARPPVEHWLRHRWLILVALAALVAFVIAFVL